MDVKSEIQIKNEELSFEYDSYDHDPQFFPDSVTNFATANNIKIEEPDETASMKSDLREIKEDSMLNKEQVNNDIIKPEMSEMKWRASLCWKIKCVIGVADHSEQGFQVKSSGSRPLMSGTFDLENYQDYFRCRFCNFTFKNKNKLTSHLKTHDKRKLKCAYCSYKSNHKGNLTKHLLTHNNLKLFKCSECSYECKRKAHLQSHMLTHSSLKLFKCSDCSYECNEKRSLELHLLTHSNLKLFKCPECSYECIRKSDLIRHLLIHGSLKLFKCSECSFECNQKGSLKRHLQTHGNLKLFKCSECSYEFKQKRYLRNHILRKHELTQEIKKPKKIKIH